MKIYGDSRSGNCYKLKLLCSMLEISYEWITVDILAGETHIASFLSKNPNGKIPLLELDDGQCLSESNAMLNYLARDSDLIPSDSWQWAKMLEWQFFEQYSHEPYIAVARFIRHYLGLPESRRAEYDSKQQGGHKALKVMNQQLIKTPFLVGKEMSLADISLYAYTHVAEEGGFELENYPGILNWFKNIETHPKYVSMY